MMTKIAIQSIFIREQKDGDGTILNFQYTQYNKYPPTPETKLTGNICKCIFQQIVARKSAITQTITQTKKK